MDRSGLRYAAGALAVAVAGIHFYWGFPQLVVYLQAGQFPDPRPLLFLASGAAILLGIAQILDGRNPKPIYLAGIALIATYIVGYALWHTGLAHGAFWPWGPEPITHDEAAWRVVLAHLANDPLASVSKLLEAVLLGLLTVLYRSDGAARDEGLPAAIRGE
ncbi:hypothetical protein EGH24_05670 [Halonotius terrestris]|uniref:Uncharacterized protein n=1 Tax=Halonotius terrestris TaxID=2487750 RepID=A0A8J8TD78_9EURY|nr:hypothetical protein [Halonotius terrestris]TQQ82924.1 hypothetical protein EGH24_05670 [Halonotius terrestris]